LALVSLSEAKGFEILQSKIPRFARNDNGVSDDKADINDKGVSDAKIVSDDKGLKTDRRVRSE
jgi:hypothetical protein